MEEKRKQKLREEEVRSWGPWAIAAAHTQLLCRAPECPAQFRGVREICA